VPNDIIIGSRGSVLALRQAEEVKKALERLAPGLRVSVKTITTRGDRIRDKSLSTVGGKGFFTKEIETELLAGTIHLAVHSAKDLPTELPDGLRLAAVTERLDPRDVLLSPRAAGLDDLPRGAAVGTGSLRRTAQILARRPDLRVVPMRGNLDTRLRKLKGNEADAIVVARAGLLRLGIAHDPEQIIPVDTIMPAPGQGALAVEARCGGDELDKLLASLNHVPSWTAVSAERVFLAELHGGCQVPVGIFTEVAAERIEMRAVVCSPDGKDVVRTAVSGPVSEHVELAVKLARDVIARGGGEILVKAREHLS